MGPLLLGVAAFLVTAPALAEDGPGADYMRLRTVAISVQYYDGQDWKTYPKGLGTGFLVHPGGYLLTAKHVAPAELISDQTQRSRVRVLGRVGDRSSAETELQIVDVHPQRDAMLLKIHREPARGPFEYFELTDKLTLPILQVSAVGFPALRDGAMRIITAHMTSDLGEGKQLGEVGKKLEGGFSGGPVLYEREVVGLVESSSTVGQRESYNFVPIRSIKGWLSENISLPKPLQGSRQVTLKGPARLELIRHLDDRWSDLRIFFDVPRTDVSKWQKGEEPERLLDWLEQRNRLNELLPAFKALHYDDLIKYLTGGGADGPHTDEQYPNSQSGSIPARTSGAGNPVLQISQDSFDTYFDIPLGDNNTDPPEGRRSRVHFRVDFILKPPFKEEIHEAKLFLLPHRKPEYTPYGLQVFDEDHREAILMHAGGQELGREIEHFVAKNPPFKPVTLEANASKRIIVPAFSTLEPQILRKEDKTADILVSLHIGTEWMFFLVRTGKMGGSMAKIHGEIIWRKDCSPSVLKEVLDSIGKVDSNFNSSSAIDNVGVARAIVFAVLLLALLEAPFLLRGRLTREQHHILRFFCALCAGFCSGAITREALLRWHTGISNDSKLFISGSAGFAFAFAVWFAFRFAFRTVIAPSPVAVVPPSPVAVVPPPPVAVSCSIPPGFSFKHAAEIIASNDKMQVKFIDFTAAELRVKLIGGEFGTIDVRDALVNLHSLAPPGELRAYEVEHAPPWYRLKVLTSRS
jgi:hypothetical protein